MNKEIEEMIQNRIEDIYQSGEYIYQAKELEEILSYIEQLEAEIRESNESITWWTNRYNAVEKNKKQLENNRDKAIDKVQYIIDYGFDYDGLNSTESLKGLIDMLVDYARDTKKILKGDSDE